jgi:hypothetical protein
MPSSIAAIDRCTPSRTRGRRLHQWSKPRTTGSSNAQRKFGLQVVDAAAFVRIGEQGGLAGVPRVVVLRKDVRPEPFRGDDAGRSGHRRAAASSAGVSLCQSASSTAAVTHRSL